MPRVLLVYHNPLFAHSIRGALSAQSDIAVVGETDDWTRAAADIARLTPDVVIVEEDGREATDSALHELSQRQTSWRVIALRLDETTMRIWSGAWRTVERTQDLIDVVLTT